MALASAVVPPKLGHFRIIEKLGEGGMGVVYRAHDEHLSRDVAVKVLPAGVLADDEARRRFRKEALALSRLNHPNIAAIHDFDTEAGIDFIVMEFVAGETLREKLEQGALDSHKILDYGTQLADALSAAHGQKVIHRDLKPENLRIAADGRLKVLDFGLAKLIRADVFDGTTATLSKSQGQAGTLPYMAPEQLRGDALDARTDIWGAGAVMYEMATGRRPFAGIGMEVVSDILNTTPARPRLEGKFARELQQTILKCLEKQPARRFQSAAALAEHLRDIVAPRPFSFLRHPAFIAAVAVLLLCVAVVVRHNLRVRWARNVVLPQIEAMVENERCGEALKVAESVEGYVTSDVTFRKLLDECGVWTDIHTNPEGAEAYLRPYGASASPWTRMGTTPVKYRLPLLSSPNELLELRFEKTGYTSFHGFNPGSAPGENRLSYKLPPASETPAGMVVIPGRKVRLPIPGYTFTLEPVTLDEYWLDAYEVTNRDYKRFVDAGGYVKPEYWHQPFSNGSRTLRFEQAMQLFRDKTGRLGPSTWEAGTYPEETADLPVTGVSWFEANAFAEFSGKSLPTMFHWYYPALPAAAEVIAPRSNFGNRGLAKGGSGLGPFGTFDMAGNAKEWCWNSSGSKRFIVGGAYNEPRYMFVEPDAQSPFRRDATYGFRLAKYSKRPPEEAFREINQPFRDYNQEQPVADAVFEGFRGFYRYDSGPLNAKVESVDNSNEFARRERISLDAGYGGERVIVYVFTPKSGHPPFQTIMFYPAADQFFTRKPEQIELRYGSLDLIVKSGRAVVWPVYKGTNERHDALNYIYQDTSVLWRDHVVMWSKEFSRAIDYVESRTDLDHDRIGYYGVSSGSVMGPVLTAMEPRVKANVFLAGGYQLTKTRPECDALNFAPRVKQPTLMINGNLDRYFPPETTQKPLFSHLGTAIKDKRYAVFESGHIPPKEVVIKETLEWFDKYLGPVGTP